MISPVATSPSHEQAGLGCWQSKFVCRDAHTRIRVCGAASTAWVYPVRLFLSPVSLFFRLC